MVRLIREFANSRQMEINKLINTKDNLREHLMRVYYWRNTIYKNHWCDEIFVFIPIMNKLKGTHKHLSESTIYEYLFTDWAETYLNDINIYVDKLMVKEKGLPRIVDKDVSNLYDFLNNFYKQISHILATKGGIGNISLYRIIDKLLRRYPYAL